MIIGQIFQALEGGNSTTLLVRNASELPTWCIITPPRLRPIQLNPEPWEADDGTLGESLSHSTRFERVCPIALGS
jgi:hypothetical protein